jgi:hypothetical protein
MPELPDASFKSVGLQRRYQVVRVIIVGTEKVDRLGWGRRKDSERPLLQQE